MDSIGRAACFACAILVLGSNTQCKRPTRARTDSGATMSAADTGSLEVPDCPTVDPVRLARLVENPLAETPEPSKDPGRRRGPQPTFDYAFSDCHGVMLTKYRARPKAWSLVCYESCHSATRSGLGELEYLADDRFDDPRGDRVYLRWYLVKDGPLAGNVVASIAVGSHPTTWELDITSPAGIQEEHTSFIFDWICTNRRDLPGFDKKSCAER